MTLPAEPEEAAIRRLWSCVSPPRVRHGSSDLVLLRGDPLIFRESHPRE